MPADDEAVDAQIGIAVFSMDRRLRHTADMSVRPMHIAPTEQRGRDRG